MNLAISQAYFIGSKSLYCKYSTG